MMQYKENNSVSLLPNNITTEGSLTFLWNFFVFSVFEWDVFYPDILFESLLN